MLSAYSRLLSQRAFTMAEALAAIVFMAILVPVAIDALRISNRAAVLAVRREEAGRLARRLLAESTLNDNWRQSEREGDFGEDAPGYSWILEDDAWEEDTMLTLAVEVFFTVQDRQYSVRLTTLVPEESDTTETDSEETEETA